MKKYLFLPIVVLVVACATGAFASPSVHAQVQYTFNNDLTVGSTGSDVSALQGFLIEKGWSIPAITSGGAATGYFGSQTMNALMQYQASLGLQATGYFNSVTRVQVNAALAGVGGGGGSISPAINCPAGFICSPTLPPVVNCPLGYVCTLKTSGSVTPSNQAPVVTAVEGPTVLAIDQQGTWIVRASDAEAGNLTYSVTWGDESTNSLSTTSTPLVLERSQSATFSHTYTRSANYVPVFMAKDAQGNYSEARLSVRVGSGAPVNLRSCPQVQVTERRLNSNMGGADIVAQYYLSSGQRREFSEFDRMWVGSNCSVALQTVYIN